MFYLFAIVYLKCYYIIKALNKTQTKEHKMEKLQALKKDLQDAEKAYYRVALSGGYAIRTIAARIKTIKEKIEFEIAINI